MTHTALVTVRDLTGLGICGETRAQEVYIRVMTAHLESGAAGRDGAVHVPGPGVGGQPDEKLP